jgi:hypothetical protein
LLGLGFLAMSLGAMPGGIVSVARLLLPLGLILEPLAERIAILKDYLGGSPPVPRWPELRGKCPTR